MSQRFIDYGGVTYDVFAGEIKVRESTIIDPDTGNVMDLSDTEIFDTGIIKVLRPDLTEIGRMSVSYTTRDQGIVQWIPRPAIFSNDNAGNWIGEIVLYNTDGEEVLIQRFNLNILQS